MLPVNALRNDTLEVTTFSSTSIFRGALVYVLLVMGIHGLIFVVQNRFDILADFPLAAVSPTLVVLGVVAISGRGQLLGQLMPDLRWVGRYGASIVVPLLIFTLSYQIGRWVWEVPGVPLLTMVSKQLRVALSAIPLLFVGAILEEIGWRGYLQPLLEMRLSLIVAAIITGLAWGAWHLSYYKFGWEFMLGFLLFTLSASVWLGWLLKGTQAHLPIAVLFHAFVNVGFVLFYAETFDDVGANLVNGLTWLSSLSVLWLLNRFLS